jgi:hypothetical protein
VIESAELAGGRPWATASLRIASDQLSADSIGERLGLRPSSTRAAEGEPAFSVWVMESGLEPSAPLEDHLYILMEQLRDRRDLLVELAEESNVEIWLSFSPGDVAGGTSVFTHDSIVELGELGVDLVFDPSPAGGKRPRASAGA